MDRDKVKLNGITRREFLRVAAAFAGASTLGTFVAGCAAPTAAPQPVATTAPVVVPTTAPVAVPTVVSSQARTDIFMQVNNDYQETVQNLWVPAIEKALPVKIYVEPGVSADAMAKMRAEKSNPKHHIMMMDAPIVAQAKQEDLVIPLDKSVMSNLADIFPSYLVEDGYGVGIGAGGMGISYYTKAAKPTSWADLWKPDFKGKVSPPAFTTTNGVVFWVMAGAIKSGKSVQDAQRDPDACFAGMKDLKPNIHSFWSNDAQQFQLMSTGELWYMGAANTKGAFQNQAKGLAIDWVEPKEGAFQLLNSATVVKGSTNEKLAMQVLNLMIGAENLAAVDTLLFLGPTNSKIKLPENVASKVPTTPEAVARLIKLDWNWISAQRSAWTDRWNKEIAQ